MPHDRLRIDLRPVAQADLAIDQYCGLWAVEESRFASQLACVAKIDLTAHVAWNADKDVSAVPAAVVAAEPAAAEQVPTRGSKKIAVIEISGTLTKRGSSLGSGGMSRMRQVIRSAARDPEIDGILLRIDSPGGTVAGTADLADEIAAARKAKPVFAFVEDLAASAAYWIAAQAEKVYANTATADVGSIGVYMALYDYSRMAEKEGLEAIVIRSSALKGAGFPGEKITDEQKAVWQELVDVSFTEFQAAVKRGRGMNDEQIAAVATGRVYRASEAQRLRLIDGIQSFDATLAELAAAASRTPKKGRTMAAASYAELIVACDGVDPKNNAEDAKFITSQLDQEATAEAAGKAWCRELKARADAAIKAKVEFEAQAAERVKAAESLKAAPGVDPLEEKGAAAAAGTAYDEFFAIVSGHEKAGLSKDRAISKAVRENADLHKQMIAEVNAGRRQR